MKTVELNNKLRRFFTRFGGGGVKALEVNPIDISNSEGGGDEQPFDAKKFGDDVVKQLYGDNLESLVFPDLYLIPSEDSAVTPDSAEMFAASLITDSIAPLYESIPDSDKDVITISFNRLSVTYLNLLTWEMDGKTYYIFKNGPK